MLQQELQESRQDFSIVQNELIETQKELSSKQDWISPRNFNQEKEAWERTKILEISEFKKRLESAESQNNELQSEYTSLQEEFDRLVIDEEKNKDEMSRKLEESVTLYEQSNAERELLKREVSKLKEESGEFRTEIAILQKQIDGYANWISPEIHQSSETSIASLKSQLLQQMEFIETLQKQIQEKDKVIHEIKAGSDEASERDDRLDLSLIQLEKFKNVIQSLKLINKNLEEKNEINEKIIHEKLQSIQILESQIQAFSSFPSNGNTPGKQQQIRFASNNSSVVNPTLTLNSPIIFFEIGSFTTRIGIWKENQFLQW